MQDKPFQRTWERFLKGDDAYKNARLKLITSVVDASWLVKKTIGKPVPALIGNKLTCHWRQTEDLLECTCDVNSSMAAKVRPSPFPEHCTSFRSPLSPQPRRSPPHQLAMPSASTVPSAFRQNSSTASGVLHDVSIFVCESWSSRPPGAATGSQPVSQAILGVVKSACKNIVCDLVLLIEGRETDELPERVIGAARYVKHDLAKYTYVD